MKYRTIKIIVIACFLFLPCFLPVSYAQDLMGLKEIPPFTKEDRVLILAPHPDDEIIGTVGVLQKALQAGANVKVVCYTNGDANQLSFIVYEKRLTFFKGEILHMGEVRRKETIDSLRCLGIDPAQVIFLGYPDFGTMEILTKYWGDVKPYKSSFTRVSKVSYPEALSPGSPYAGESILRDLKAVILGYKPTKIFVSHPADTNRDHRALYLFLQVALWDLENQMKRPEVYPYIIHVVGWPKPRGYRPNLSLEPPKKYTGVSWRKLTLSDADVKTKRICIRYFKSQIEYAPWYLYTFARKNELFGDYPPILLKKQTGPDVEWEYFWIPGEEENKEPSEKETGERSPISALAYARNDDYLWVRITTNKKFDKDYGISLYLLGYSKTRPFAEMPKVRLYIGLWGVKINDKKNRLIVKDFKIAYEKKAVILKIPLSILGDPDRILSSAHASGFPYDATAWRILELE